MGKFPDEYIGGTSLNFCVNLQRHIFSLCSTDLAWLEGMV